MTLEPRTAPRTAAERRPVRPPGLLVTDVLPGSAAAAASVAPGDLLVALDGTATVSEGRLHQAMTTAAQAAYL